MKRALAIVLASSVLAAPVLAQPAPPTDAQKKQVGDLANKAAAKSEEKKFEEAAELYLEAYKIYPLATMLSNAGAQYQKAGKKIEALRYFCMYLEKDPAGIVVTYATAQATALQHELGNTSVDEKNPCAPAEPLPLPPGGEKLEAPTGQPPPPPEGGTTSRGGGGGALKITGLVAGGLGLVGLGAGMYFGFKARDISDKITNHDPMMPWPDDIKQLEADGASYEKKQIIFLVAGDITLLAGTGAFIYGRTKSNAEQVSIVPTVSPDGAGVTFTGGF